MRSLRPAIEIERCQRCGGALKAMASIEDPVLIEHILAHVGQPAEEQGLVPFATRGPPQRPPKDTAAVKLRI